jgi:hypothetical protein
MRLPRFRFTVRLLLILVTLVALGLGLDGWMVRRSARFRRLVDHHALVGGQSVEWGPGHCGMAVSTPRSLYHWELVAKYQHAARYPWFPVESDLPEPK